MENQEECAMESATTTNVHDENDDPAPIAPSGASTIAVDGNMLHIRELSTERATIVMYLQTIAPSKQEIALLHALEVGIKELAARRVRFQH